MYFELIIYELNTYSSGSEVYIYNSNKKSYDINIPQGKFYKLAFRYISCNFTNVDIINSSFKIYCEKQDLDLTPYLFGGANINRDYTNNTIMNLFSDVNYKGNSNTNYTSIISFLDNPEGIDFFNIKKFYNDNKWIPWVAVGIILVILIKKIGLLAFNKIFSSKS